MSPLGVRTDPERRAVAGPRGGHHIPGDWWGAPVPPNVAVAPDAYLETAYSFHAFRSERSDAVTIGSAASVYLGTTFDMGPAARVAIGAYTLVNAAQLSIDGELLVGDHVLISWGVVIMDSYRVPVDPDRRRALLAGGPAASTDPPPAPPAPPPGPMVLGAGSWVGFGACLLPGASLGEGAVVGARSVVTGPVEPDTVVAGNPARPVRRLAPASQRAGR